MMGYLFSMKSAEYEKIKGMLKAIDEARARRKGAKTEEEAESQMEAEDEAYYQIEAVLLSSARHETLESVEHEIDESTMIMDFKYFFIENNVPLRKEMIDSPLPPEKTRKLWDAVNSGLARAGAKKKMMEYARQQNDERGYHNKPAEFEAAFKKWSTILKHAAENGNWYYHLVMPR